MTCATCQRPAVEDEALCPSCSSYVILGPALLREIADRAEAARTAGKRWRGPSPARCRRLADHLDHVEEAIP